MEGGGNGCKWEKDPLKILVYTDPTKQYCEGERCVVLGDEHHDNASRMRKRLHDMLVNIVPSCPAADSRGFCVKKKKSYCAQPNVNLGELDVTECAKLIEE